MPTRDDILLRDIKHLSDFEHEDGDINTIEGLENLRLALLHRLVTTPGSLIHRPDYGVGIKEFQNSVNSIDNQRIISNRIEENFKRDPRVAEVSSVSVEANSDPSLVRIVVKVIAIGREEVDVEFIPFAEGIQI